MKYKTVGALLFIIVICVMFTMLVRESFTEGADKNSRVKGANYKRHKKASQSLDTRKINIATGERVNDTGTGKLNKPAYAGVNDVSKADASNQYSAAQKSVQINKPVAKPA